jgi:hypothetical protein
MRTVARAACVASLLLVLTGVPMAAPALGQTLGPSDSVREDFRSTIRFVAVNGVGCGTSSTGTLTLDSPLRGQSKAYGITVRRPTVGDRDGGVSVTAVRVADQSVLVTATADPGQCDLDEGRWSARFGADVSFARRVQIRMQRSLIFQEAGKPLLRPSRIRLNAEESMRRIRWKHFGGPTATGTGTYRLKVPRGCNARRCPGLRRSLALNGRRMTVKLSRAKRCPTLEYTRGRVTYRGKVWIPTGTFCGGRR